MAHTSSKSSKKSGDKSSGGSSHRQSTKSHVATSSVAEQWVQHQAVDGPWDAINEVVGEAESPGDYHGYAYAGSMAAGQGSTKHKAKKHGSKE